MGDNWEEHDNLYQIQYGKIIQWIVGDNQCMNSRWYIGFSFLVI